MTLIPIFSQLFCRATQSIQTGNTANTADAANDLETLDSQLSKAIMGGIDMSSASVDSRAHPPGLPECAEKSPKTLWSDSLQALLEQPPASLPQYLILGGIVFTAFMGCWSWFGTLEEVSMASGQLAPQGEVYKVQPPVSGEVVSILVAEGDYVTQGQTIAKLDQQLVEKEIERLTHGLNASQQQLLQTQGLIQQTQLGLNTLQTISRADIAARQSSIAQERAVISTHERMLSQLQFDRQAQIERMERLMGLVEQGAFATEQLFQVEHALRDRDRSITEAQGMTERSNANLDQLEAELAQTQALAEKNELDAIRQLQQLQIEVTQLEAAIQETRNMLAQRQAELSQATLVAPVSGIVSALEIANVGEVVQAGQTVIEIAPSSAPLVLSALLPTEKAGLVERNMPVNIKLDAFPYQDYGVITGKILSISPDARVHERAGVVYRIEVALDTAQVDHSGQKIALRAGQTATAEIVVRKRRIISIVLEPIRKLRKDSLNL
jgi:hemolysin D